MVLRCRHARSVRCELICVHAPATGRQARQGLARHTPARHANVAATPSRAQEQDPEEVLPGQLMIVVLNNRLNLTCNLYVQHWSLRTMRGSMVETLGMHKHWNDTSQVDTTFMPLHTGRESGTESVAWSRSLARTRHARLSHAPACWSTIA